MVVFNTVPVFFFNQSSWWRIMSSNSSILTSNWMTFHFKISLMISKSHKSYDRCNKNAFKQLTLIKTCSLWNIFIMSLPPRYAIAKKGQVDKYSKIFGLFGNLALRVCQGPSTCTRTFKHGDPGYEVVTKFRSACENHTTPADDFEGDFAGECWLI
jgi:hypothetical protein